MKHITFWLDFISPYAYLAFEKLPQSLQGLTYSVDYRPVLFAAFLNQHGQLGPAEIPPKRDWTYRQVLWTAHAHGIPMQMPAAHPFNPLAHLRLSLACGEGGIVNRHVAETIFREVWRTGADAADPARIESLKQQLQPRRDVASAEVKGELKSNTDAALARGLFGVPTMEVDGKLFWGFDALPMLREYLEGNEWFGREWDRVTTLPTAVARAKRSA